MTSVDTGDNVETGEPSPSDRDAESSASASASASFRLPTHDRVIAGVAGSIAEGVGLSVSWVRLFFVVLALVGGVGVVVYVGLWATLAGRYWDSQPMRIIGGLILLAGLPLFLSVSGVPLASGPWAVIALLVGVALLLWQQPQTAKLSRQARPSASGADGGNADEIFILTDADSMAAAPANPGAYVTQTHGVPTPQRREHHSSMLGRATFGIALSVAAVGALIDANNGGRLHPEQWLGAAAVVCGLGLIVGTTRGYGRWLIVPAVAFAVAGMIGGELARFHIPIGNAFTSENISVFSSSPETSYQMIQGFASGYISIEEELTHDVTIDATVVAGGLTISAAEDVRVEVDAVTPNGSLYVNGVPTDTDSAELPGHDSDGGPVVHINAHVEHGDVDLSSYQPIVEPASPPDQPWSTDLPPASTPPPTTPPPTTPIGIDPVVPATSLVYTPEATIVYPYPPTTVP